MKLSPILTEYFETQTPQRRKIFEGLPAHLPVSVQRSEWERNKSQFFRKYNFLEREELKDFVQIALDIDDEAGSRLDVKILGKDVSISFADDDNFVSRDNVSSMLDSAYSEITLKAHVR